MRADYTFRIDQPYPPLSNDATVSEHVEKAAKKIAGEERVRSINKPEMEGRTVPFLPESAKVLFLPSDCVWQTRGTGILSGS